MRFIYQNKLILINLAILIVWLALVTDLLSQEISLVNLENEFAQIDSSIAKLNSQRRELSRQIQSNAKEIQELRDKDKLNYFQHQRLERLLKESQDLSNQVEHIDSELRTLDKLYRKTGNRLISIYDSEIKKSLNKLEKKKISPDLSQALFQTIENLRLKKEQVKQKISPSSLARIKISKLQIDPDDTPKQVEQKADLLKDQEDKLRHLVEQIRRQTKELHKELEIRNRMNDLVTDLALFDQQEEALGDVSTVNKETMTLDERGNPTTTKEFIEENLLVGQKDFDFSNLATHYLEDAIEQLKKRQQTIEAQADSLADRAQAFYQAAQEMKR